jgi:hypothetical protein
METLAKEKKTQETNNNKFEKLYELIETAVDRGDTKILEKLLEFQKQINKDIAKAEFYKALHGFQSELQPIKKSNVVYNKDGSIRYKYASFDDIVKAIQPLLKKYGLTFHFKAEYDEKNQTITVHCIITHIMGHQEIATFKAPLTLPDKMQFMQAYGSILTYAKRYSLSLALGLATEEDENIPEEHVIEKILEPKTIEPTTIEPTIIEPTIIKPIPTEPKIIEPKPTTPKTQPAQPEEKTFESKTDTKTAENKITESQKRYLLDLLNRHNLKLEELYHYVLSTHGKIITSIDDLTKTEASKIIDALKNWTTEKKTENITNDEIEDVPF